MICILLLLPVEEEPGGRCQPAARFPLCKKVAPCRKKSFEKVACLWKKSLEKVVTLEEKSLEKIDIAIQKAVLRGCFFCFQMIVEIKK